MALSTALLELMVLGRAAGVGLAGDSSVGKTEFSSVAAAEVSSVGEAEVSNEEAAGAGKCIERLASASVFKLAKVSRSIVARS